MLAPYRCCAAKDAVGHADAGRDGARRGVVSQPHQQEHIQGDLGVVVAQPSQTAHAPSVALRTWRCQGCRRILLRHQYPLAEMGRIEVKCHCNHINRLKGAP